MAELSVSETTTFRWSFEEDVAQYSAAGIPAIGIWRHKLSDCGLSKAVELLEQGRLAVSHLSWAGGFTGADGRSFRESVDDGLEAIHSASQMNCRTLVLYSGPRAGHTHNHARRLFLTALKELVPPAAESNVTLAVKPMHPGCAGQWTFLTSLDEALDLVDRVAEPQVKMALDTYHLGQNGDLLDRIAGVVDRVAIVQLGDAQRPPNGEQNRCRLGQGVVPLREIVAALKTAGYDGYYDVELLGEAIEPADYRSLLSHAKEAYADLLT